MDASQYPRSLDDSVARLVEQLDPERREAYEERAALMEFDGGMPREDAEPAALIDILDCYGWPGSGPVRVLRAEIRGRLRWLLTTDETHGRTILSALGATEIVEVELVEVVHVQFGDAAFLHGAP